MLVAWQKIRTAPARDDMHKTQYRTINYANDGVGSSEKQ